MFIWNDPLLLSAYRHAPKGPGVYIIGLATDPTQPVTANAVDDDYLGTWPDNFQGIYVGISESAKSGVRGRLSRHWRGRGNAYVRQQRAAGASLWFITEMGQEAIEYEALLLLLKQPGLFEGNIRSELERSAMRRAAKRRAKMSDHDREFYDWLDMGEHGNGM